MLTGFLLSLREGLEAALIIGIVFGVLHKTNRTELKPFVWVGTIAAVLVSVMVALALNWLGMEFEGAGEQIFEGVAMLLAAGILTWMIFWMRQQGRSIKGEIEAKMGTVLVQNSGRGLFILAFLAVVREGIELALFLVAARMTSSPFQTLAGAVAGLIGAALLGWMIQVSAKGLNMKTFFQGTNFLLVLFAAGLVGLGIHEFNELGWIPAVVEHLWDFSLVLSDEAGFGSILKALFGYSAAPSLTMVLGYLAYLGTIVFSLIKVQLSPSAVRAN